MSGSCLSRTVKRATCQSAFSPTPPLYFSSETNFSSSAASRKLLLCRGRGPGRPGPPAQIPACGFPAPGSCRRSNAIEVRGFGGPCTPNPQACSFGYTPHPALRPGRALLLAFPPAGRLPSTISATDLRSALFEVSLVLCGRPTPHLSRDGFASSASRRGPAPP